MGISFNFNDKHLAEMEEMEREIEAEKAAMTEEEKEAEKKQVELEFEQLLKMAQKDISEKQKKIDSKKVEEFKELSKLAVGVAGILELNIDIKVSENGLYGDIDIKADSIMIVKAAPKEAKQGFAMMIAAATETMIFSREDYIEMNLLYDFYEEEL